ncbi:hypothetical protein [Candidatus Nitrosocosmicus sp. R]|jgi:hypothetical protein
MVIRIAGINHCVAITELLANTRRDIDVDLTITFPQDGEVTMDQIIFGYTRE